MTVKLDLRNKIINGALDFWQRGTTSNASQAYLADRFITMYSGTMVRNILRSADVPVKAFGEYSIHHDVTTAQATLVGTDYSVIQHYIEGNIYRSIKGKKVVLSFWVKATKVGTYCVSFRGTDWQTKNYIAEYTVNASDVWEKKTIRLTMNESGTVNYGSGVGLRVCFVIASGPTYRTSVANEWLTTELLATNNQVNGVDSINNDFKLTDIVLVEDNEGQTREPEFMYAGRDYFEELQLCQRYFEQCNFSVSTGSNNTGFVTGGGNFVTSKRNAGYALSMLPWGSYQVSLGNVGSYNKTSGVNFHGEKNEAHCSVYYYVTPGEFGHTVGGVIRCSVDAEL